MASLSSATLSHISVLMRDYPIISLRYDKNDQPLYYQPVQLEFSTREVINIDALARQILDTVHAFLESDEPRDIAQAQMYVHIITEYFEEQYAHKKEFGAGIFFILWESVKYIIDYILSFFRTYCFSPVYYLQGLISRKVKSLSIHEKEKISQRIDRELNDRKAVPIASSKLASRKHVTICGSSFHNNKDNSRQRTMSEYSDSRESAHTAISEARITLAGAGIPKEEACQLAEQLQKFAGGDSKSTLAALDDFGSSSGSI